MTQSTKQQVIMTVFGCTPAEVEALTTPDDGNKRLNALYKTAKKELARKADLKIAQSLTITLD
ncbi:hypothetical protein [Lactiplantibacillus paraxiangfangensis]|uniref:hypothetical protein n=1 Tax=Lactiplantibacillus paraxiangfangensis TaxID=3076224 RepID=UPI0030C66BB5